MRGGWGRVYKIQFCLTPKLVEWAISAKLNSVHPTPAPNGKCDSKDMHMVLNPHRFDKSLINQN